MTDDAAVAVAASEARGTPVAAGTRLRADPSLEWVSDTLVAGGSPWRLVRLTERGAGLLGAWLDGEAVSAEPAAGALARRLTAAGHRVRLGPIITTPHIIGGADERAALAAGGAIAVDMESAPIARALVDRVPVAVVRVIVDTPAAPVRHLATVRAGIAALRRLRAIGPVIGTWEGAGDAIS